MREEDQGRSMEKRQGLPKLAMRRIAPSTYQFLEFHTTGLQTLRSPNAVQIGLAVADSARESANGFRAGRGHANLANFRFGKYLRFPEKTNEAVFSAKFLSQTSRPDARPVAPLTVTCCPRIARVASSKLSQQPATRMPGSPCNFSANVRSFRSDLEIEVQPPIANTAPEPK